MAKRHGMWVRELTKPQKAVIAARCDRFIDDVLKPRFLPRFQPTEFSYTIDIFGRWRASSYRFVQRFRSGRSETLGEEFEQPFARLDYREDHLAETRFDVMWYRHTGRWWRLHPLLTLDQALQLMETEELLWPV